jgi:hypothetical protein
LKSFLVLVLLCYYSYKSKIEEVSKIGKRILIILTIYHLALILIGFFLSPVEEIKAGLINILRSPSILITDYIVIGGLGATFVNSGLVGLSEVLVAYLSGAKISGLIIAGVFTMSGFAMFGKNIFTRRCTSPSNGDACWRDARLYESL